MIMTVISNYNVLDSVVILVKYWFMVLARLDSSEIRLFFSISNNVSVLKPLLLKKMGSFFGIY